MALNLFYFLSFLAILSGLMVVLSRNPVHSVLYLIITFFAIAGHYVLMNAQFLAAVHVIVYAGAILVLFLYVIMMLNLNETVEPHKSKWLKIAATVTGGLLMLVFVGVLRKAGDMGPGVSSDPQIGLVENIGKILYTDFILPFEITSILLLAAMVGAVMLGKKDKPKTESITESQS